jgi:ketosteroid isomerase-like protein
MTERANEAIVRSGYEAHAEGDLARLLQFVDPDLEWTYLTRPPRIRNPGLSWTA